MTNIDVDRTTYHEANSKIWRIDSGTDYGEVWDLDIFEQHAEDYLEEGEEPFRDEESDLEILKADFDGRGYRLIKNNEDDRFHLLFYLEPESDIENTEAYIDSVWADEIDTILSETAKAKITLRHELDNSEDQYKKRLAGKL